MKKIEDLNDEELNYYMASAKQFNESQMVASLVELDPTNPMLKEIRTLHYRLRQEAARRRTDELAEDFDKKFKDLEYVPLTPDELSVVIPEWPPAPEEAGGDEEGQIDFVGKDDEPRPVEEEPVQGNQQPPHPTQNPPAKQNEDYKEV